MGLQFFPPPSPCGRGSGLVARCPGGSSQIVPRNVSLRMDFERQQFLLPLSD